MKIVFDEPEGDFGQIGGFADSVDATEGDHERALIPLSLQSVAKDVNTTLGGQNLGKGGREKGGREREWAER